MAACLDCFSLALLDHKIFQSLSFQSPGDYLTTVNKDALICITGSFIK